MTSEQERIQLEKEQELQLKQKAGGLLPKENKQKKFLLKKDRQYFDSADYVIGGKQNEQNQKTIPKTVQKGELLHPSARKLSPRNVEHDDDEVAAASTTLSSTDENEEEAQQQQPLHHQSSSSSSSSQATTTSPPHHTLPPHLRHLQQKYKQNE